MFPFMARERFCYFLVAFHVADFVKTTFKNSFHEPRPVFMWSDMSPHTCAMTFGLPSGHSAESANFVLVLLLDQFKPSRWSKSTYPELNSRTSSNSPYALAALLLLVFTYWPMVVYDRIVLGKHTLNQVLLGSQIGFWCACFSHFCLRDFVYCHVTKIINGETRLTKDRALKYTLNAVKLVAVLFTFQVIVAYVGAMFLRIDPTWLKNLANTCGEKFQTDEDGNYIVEDKFATFFAQGIPSVANHLCSVLGLYLGLIAYRYKGNGRLGPNAFESDSPLKQIVYAISMMLLTQAPEKVVHTFTTPETSLIL